MMVTTVEHTSNASYFIHNWIKHPDRLMAFIEEHGLDAVDRISDAYLEETYGMREVIILNVLICLIEWGVT
jgi:hypothetical protein